VRFARHQQSDNEGQACTRYSHCLLPRYAIRRHATEVCVIPSPPRPLSLLVNDPMRSARHHHNRQRKPSLRLILSLLALPALPTSITEISLLPISKIRQLVQHPLLPVNPFDMLCTPACRRELLREHFDFLPALSPQRQNTGSHVLLEHSTDHNMQEHARTHESVRSYSPPNIQHVATQALRSHRSRLTIKAEYADEEPSLSTFTTRAASQPTCASLRPRHNSIPPKIHHSHTKVKMLGPIASPKELGEEYTNLHGRNADACNSARRQHRKVRPPPVRDTNRTLTKTHRSKPDCKSANQGA
jgi:hypothetical protein